MSIEVNQPQNHPLRTPVITANYGDDAEVETKTEYPERTKFTVQVGEGFNNVQLPNGFPYNAGDEVELTRSQYQSIDPRAFASGVLVDLSES